MEASNQNTECCIRMKDAVDFYKIISRNDVIKIVTAKIGLNFELLAYSFNEMKEKLGMLGLHFFLKTTVKTEGVIKKHEFFVKSIPTNNHTATFVKEELIFQKEIDTYKIFEYVRCEYELFNDVVTHCYFSRTNELLVFDNLIHDGYTLFEGDFDLETTKRVVVALAKFQAASLVYEERRSAKLGKPYRFIDKYPEALSEKMFSPKKFEKCFVANKKGFDAEMDYFNMNCILSNGIDFKEYAIEILLKLPDLVKPSEKCRNVLCHGDLWRTNFLMKNNDVKFIDFQFSRYCSPPYDLLIFIYLATTKDFRKAHLETLKQLHYSSLEECVKEAGYDIAEFMTKNQYKVAFLEQTISAVVQTVFRFPLILLDNAVLNEVLTKDSEKLFHEDKSIVFSYCNNERYHKRLIESLEDLKDVCERYSSSY